MPHSRGLGIALVIVTAVSIEPGVGRMSHFDTKKVFVAASLALILLNTACGRPTPGINNENTSAASSDTVIDLSPLVFSGKVTIEDLQAPPSNLQVAALTTATLKTLPSPAKLLAGEKLVVTINNECAKLNPTPFTNSIQAQQAVEEHLNIQAYSLALNSNSSVGELESLISDEECVDNISRDGQASVGAVPNDPGFSKQNQHLALETAAAFDTFYAATGGINQDVVIAIIDTGVDINHQDLASSLWRSPEGTAGYDFVNSDNQPADDNGHGTHISGLISAARNNAIGVSGAMGSRSKIMSIKSMDRLGSGSYTNVINGIRYAIANKADVISLSLSGSTQSNAMRSAILDAINAGIFVVSAAGNSGQELTAAFQVVPASYAKDINGFMSVGSIDSLTKNRSVFSNFSSSYVELGSPGSNGVLSTLMNNSYGTMAGTSMATPLVAAAGALTIGFAKSRGYVVTPDQVELAIKDSGVSLSALNTSFLNGKTLNLRSLATYLNTKYPIKTSIVAPTTTTQPRPTTTTIAPTTTTQPRPTTTTQPTTNACGTMSNTECEVLKLLNLERAKVGARALRASLKCTNAAQFHAKDMAAKNYFSHNSANETVAQRMIRFGLSGASWGENIALGYYNGYEVMTAWMSSPAHRQNMLDTKYQSLGVGVGTDLYGRLFWVQCLSAYAGDF